MGMALHEAINGAAVCRRAVLASGIASAFALSAAHAETLPSRPACSIVPFAAGSPQNLPARATAEQLTEALGRPVIVENCGSGPRG